MKNFFKPMDVKRTSPGAYVKGEWVNGSTNTVLIEGIIQRYKNLTELKKEFDGQSLKGAIKVFTSEPLQFGKKDSPADVIEYEGEDYEIIKSWNENLLIPHVVSVGVMIER